MIPYTQHSIGEEEIQAVTEVLRSECLTEGPKVVEFEAAFASYVGANHAVACNSGASALYLAVKAIFPGEGCTIAVSSLTYVATANAVLLAGHFPLFIDIDPMDFCINPVEIPDFVDGVIPVHFAGHSCNLDRIREEGEWVIIEDSAHACGAEYKGKKIGARNVSCFSFHPAKNMTAAEGGIITTASRELADKLRRMRQNGICKGFDGLKAVQNMVQWGFNFRMNEIQAAIGIVQLKKVEGMNERRREIAAIYERELGHIVRMQQVSDDVIHSRHIFPILVNHRRDEILANLLEDGIRCAVHYTPVHKMPFYRGRFKLSPLSFTEWISDRTLSIPLFPTMTEQQINHVIDSVKKAVIRWR
uniref:Putative DegT/DnrJ/EryC1/StrS aminotransferase family protein n=1 Tax=viral metagenome TaxID=1070528 RepID=A0A6M3L991_9ZZZZ